MSLLRRPLSTNFLSKFEAGTPDYIGTTGLAKALDYVNGHGLEQIAAHEHELTTYALQRLKEIPQIRIFGEAAERGAVISFLVGDIHHFDLGTLLDRLGIAVRTGHHKIVGWVFLGLGYFVFNYGLWLSCTECMGSRLLFLQADFSPGFPDF